MNQMQVLLAVAIALAFSAGGLALGAWLYPWLKNNKQGYPLENEFEALLLPFLYQAICAAYKSAEEIMRATGNVLDGVSKKAIADSVYDMLPDTISGVPVGLIKAAVSRQRFEDSVQAAYNYFDANYHGWQDSLAQEFEKWKQLQTQPA
jgi:hypothetical protein